MRLDGPIRVLIIDDSPLFARALAAELDRYADMHALTGSSEVAKLRDELVRYHPEVIILDLALRTQDANEWLRKLSGPYPVPVIVSAQGAGDGAARAVQAVQTGALEVVRRPDDNRRLALQPYARDLVGKIRMAVSVARPAPQPAGATQPPVSFQAAGLYPKHYLVAVGASTGGTKALEVFLGRVPANFPPIVIVQHMPAGFTRSFAARLSSESAACVSEAVDGEELHPGHAVIARGDTHLVVRPTGTGWRVQYTDQRLVNLHCPSVDVLFDSVAAAVGRRAVGVLLTGMGEDGARGLLEVRQAGGVTVAQSKESCVVYGMPKVAVALGAAMHTAAPEDMPALVVRALQARKRAGNVSRTGLTR